MVEYLLDRRLLDYVAGVHHRDVVTVLGDDPEVMGDEDHGHTRVLLQLAEQGHDLRLHRHVEGRGRFVRDQEHRFGWR